MLIEERLLLETHAADVALIGLFVLDLVVSHLSSFTGSETAFIALIFMNVFLLCIR